MMSTPDNSDLGATIPAASVDAGIVSDFQELRREFHIYPGEDGCKYQNLKLLGMGGMGVVFSGDDPTLERQVAVKILREPYRNDRGQIAKFINEARITARIDHPNIVAVHQLGVNEHHGVYFSMRRISGETLQNAIRRMSEGDVEALRHYTPGRLLDIFIAGCNGVAAAHEKKILHCDLKPANIMIGAFGEVLVLDWGLAREFDAPVADGKNNISGTPAYMAPELVCGEVDRPDELTDVYAMGTILYSILTWRISPFDMSLPKEMLLERVASGRYLPLRTPKGQRLPRELAAICRKAMARDRSERYATITELLADLHNFRDSRPVKAYSPNTFYRFFKLCLRHPAIPIAVIVAGFTLLAYSMTQRLIEYTNDRSFLNASQINQQVADEYFYHSIRQLQHTPQPDELSDPVRLALRERNFLLQVQLAMREYFSILDSASVLSPAGLREFAGMHAAHIFKRILILQIQAGDPEKLHEVLERCRRWEFFEYACEKDAVLAALVRDIEAGMGYITVNSGGNLSELRGKLIVPDGKIYDVVWPDGSKLRLAAGNYQLLADNGIRAFFRIVPGCNESLMLPESPDEPSAVIVPADHFFIELSDAGTIRCKLDAFMIKPYSGPGLFSIDEAGEILTRVNDGDAVWHLPTAAELQKAWRKNGSEPVSFYGLPVVSGAVLLYNGEFYHPLTGEITDDVPGKRGLLYLIRSVE